MREVRVVTPWYPSAEKPHSGAFVQAAVEATSARGINNQVIHLDNVPVPGARGELERVVNGWSTDPPARVISVAIDPTTPRWQVADADARALAAAVGSEWDAEVIHAHVGMPTGFAVAKVASPGTRLYVSEHASYLGKVLADRQGKAHYRQLAERADLLLFVSGHLRQTAARAFPEYARKMRLLPNPVDFSGLTARAEPPTDLKRWVYVGALISTKGVDRLVRSFIAAGPNVEDLHLTLVGDGVLRDELEALAEQHGVADRLHITGFVPSSEIGEILRANDVMVHLSQYETFGLATLEAIACGLPVVVTRCGGPQETLTGLEGRAVEFVDVADSEQDVVAAWQALRSRVADLDLAAGRTLIEARFGVDAIGGRLVELYEHGESRVRPVRVLAVALQPTPDNSVLADLSYLSLRSGEGSLVTVRAADWPGLDPRVQVIELEPLEDAALPMRMQRFLLLGLPDAALRGVAMVARQAGARGLISGPRARGLRGRVDRARRRCQEVGGRVHRHQLRILPYRWVRPWVLDRVLRRSILPLIGLDDFDQIVCSGPGAAATAELLRAAGATKSVAGALDRDAVERALIPTVDQQSGS